jgi:hypothetical protein
MASTRAAELQRLGGRPMLLEDKLAVVYGGGGHIGRAVARTFA